MGEWIGPDNYDTLLAIAGEVRIDDRDVTRFINAMEASGLLVRKPYYVPDIRELMGLMRELSHYMRRANSGCRWVMCRETLEALARQYVDRRVPAPGSITAFWRTDQGAEFPTAALEMEVLTVIESNRTRTDLSMLFGMPIRLDPAARSPLFEVDSKATR